MAFTIREFEELLLADEPEAIVRRQLFSASPVVFREHPEHYGLLKEHLAARLSTGVEDVRIIGSALTGFSLSPDNYPRLFSEASDIDVIVVSPELFDMAWGTVLNWHYRRKDEHLTGQDKDWMLDRRKEIYWGRLIPNQIRYSGLSLPASLVPLRDSSTRWFNAFQELGTRPEFARRVVNGRLYRTWDHAVWYQTKGLRTIKAGLLTRREEQQ